MLTVVIIISSFKNKIELQDFDGGTYKFLHICEMVKQNRLLRGIFDTHSSKGSAARMV